MENLQRRASGIYVARLTIPARLREVIGKREFITSTGTHNLSVAKLLASAYLAQWRRQLFDLDRLASASVSMDHDSIVKIADGHPILQVAGHLPLLQAAAAAGLTAGDLLRQASDGRLQLFARLEGVQGYLLPAERLEVDDAEVGTVLVPQPHAMPADARRARASGVYQLHLDDTAAIANSLIGSGEACVVVLRPLDAPTSVFVPDTPLTLESSSMEVAAIAVEAIRSGLAKSISQEALNAARSAQSRREEFQTSRAGKHAQRRLSEALDAYARNLLPQSISSPKEIERVRSGIALLAEFEGDLALADVDGDVLRHFRDVHLARMPSKENLIRIKQGTTSMTESIAAVAGTDWPVMSAAERDLRMQWIARMFRWLHDQKWITDDPSTALRTESVLTKAERERVDAGKKDREEFSAEELTRIFSTPLFSTGTGLRARNGQFREFQPFQFWLPLLGLYAGCRIGELCQLRLSDIGRTAAGNYFLDINKKTPDKSLKNAWSARQVPVHPSLIEAGLASWVEQLRVAGYERLFPELSWNSTNRYAKEPIRWMSRMLDNLDMPRDGTRVFHSFRHGVNNALQKRTAMPDIMRKRLLGHEPGEGVNERHYLSDSTPVEAMPFLTLLDFNLPAIARFNQVDGIEAVQAALQRKNGGRAAVEDMGPR